MWNLRADNMLDHSKNNNESGQQGRTAWDMCTTCNVLERGIVLCHALLIKTKKINSKNELKYEYFYCYVCHVNGNDKILLF